jgi:Outer membrane protein beta-barrel domain
MKCLHALSFVPVLLTVLASPALGQNAQAPAGGPGSYLIGVGGAALNLDFENPTTVVGGEFGERVHRDVYAYVGLTYLDNLMSQQMRDYLDQASANLGASFTGRDRGLAFTLGAKYLLPTTARLRPYFGGGFGLMNLERTISDPLIGDVTRIFPAISGLNDGVVPSGENATTNPLGELLVGFGGPFNRRGYFDVKYRYGRVFQASENVDFSQISAAIGVTF